MGPVAKLSQLLPRKTMVRIDDIVDSVCGKVGVLYSCYDFVSYMVCGMIWSIMGLVLGALSVCFVGVFACGLGFGLCWYLGGIYWYVGLCDWFGWCW